MSLTLARSRPRAYQVTFWDDGIARWDSAEGHRAGAWQAQVPVEWFRRTARLAITLHNPARTRDSDLTVVVDGSDSQIRYGANRGQEPDDVWILASVLDGMAANALWAPLDATGELDLSPWATGIRLALTQVSCAAQALARPEGLVVLAGSRPATATGPTLEDNYKEVRASHEADGTFQLQRDQFRLVRHLFFRTPSAAASVIAGSNTNGRRAWRDQEGRTWADLGFDS